MNRFLKTLLIWMLALVLPAQVTASAIKMTCGPIHHTVSATPEMLHQHSHHGMEGYTDHAHHHDVADNAIQDQSAPELSKLSGKFKSSYCSACATCCVGAAVTSAPWDWTPVYSSAYAPAMSPVSSFTGFIPPGLERPPRLFTA